MNVLRNSILLAVSTAGLSFGVDATLLALAPADTKMVAGVYLDRTRNTPFGQFALSQMKGEDSNFQSFIAAAGFDPRRDVNEVVVVSSSTAKHAPGLVLARGVFNGPGIIAALRLKGGVVTNYKGIEIVTHGAKSTGGVAFLDGKIAVAGELASVQAAIDRRNSTSSLDTKLTANIAALSGRYDAWFTAAGFAAPVGAAVPNPNVPNHLQVSALQAIESTSGGVKFGSMVEVGGEALTRSAQDAQSLLAVAQFLGGLLSMNKESSPEAGRLAALAQSIVWAVNGSKVSLSLSMAQAELEELLQSKRTRRASL